MAAEDFVEVAIRKWQTNIRAIVQVRHDVHTVAGNQVEIDPALHDIAPAAEMQLGRSQLCLNDGVFSP